MSLELKFLVCMFMVLIVLPLTARVAADINGQQAGVSLGSRFRRMIGWLHSLKQRLWRLWSFKLSQVLKLKAVAIAEKDSTKALVAEGYRVMRVIPLLKSRSM